MSFLQPWLLAALPLVALPIIIHLINQRRFQTIHWAAMMFLLAANRMSRGYARLRQWLIMALPHAGHRRADLGRQPAAGERLAGTGRRRPRRHDDHPARPLAQHAATRGAAGVSKLEPGRQQLCETLETLGSGRWVLIESATQQAAASSKSPAALLNLPTAGPARHAADLPAMLQAARDYIRDNHAGRTEIWICSDLRAERLERRQRPLAGAARRLPRIAARRAVSSAGLSRTSPPATSRSA